MGVTSCQRRRHNGPRLSNVAVVVLDEFEPFELGVVCAIFGTDRSGDGLPCYDFAVVAGEPGPLRSTAGFTLDTPLGLERMDEADLVAVPAIAEGHPRLQRQDYPEALLEALRRTVARGGRVLSVCTDRKSTRL